VPRRPKRSIELTKWPETEFPELFGEMGDERDLVDWQSFLKREAPEILASIRDLVAAGCDHRHLVRILCELHASRRWDSFSAAELKACREAILKARRVKRTLAASELRYHLLLARWNPEKGPARLDSLGPDLETLAQQIESLPWRTNRRESLLRNELLGYLASYVEWATGEPHDEELDRIIRFLITDHHGKRDTFSFNQWRKGHQRFLEEVTPKIKAAWRRAIEKGTLQEPLWHSRQPGGWSARRGV